jgi:hypothetical protein
MCLTKIVSIHFTNLLFFISIPNFLLVLDCRLLGCICKWSMHKNTYTSYTCFWDHALLPRLLAKSVLKQGVCHTRALPSTWTSISRQKKNYGNSNISPCKNIINLQKNPLKETKTLQNIVTLLLGNLKFQPQAKIYHLSKILV